MNQTAIHDTSVLSAWSRRTSPAVLRERILDLERAMFAMPEAQVELEPYHYFWPGLYARAIVIPAGTLVMGKIHKTRHYNWLQRGRITVATEAGVRTLEAPYQFWAEPGTKRVGYAHEETVWVTFHATEETDLVKLEAALIAPSFDRLEYVEAPACLG